MIGRGLFLLTILCRCVLSLPVTSSQLENEDVKVMKCIVEALADVLSRPHPIPVSQECLATLKKDDQLVTILRHHNFLKEMREIAVQGGRGRADTPTPTMPTLQATDDVPDRSMLEALGGPGEQSILSKRTGNGDGKEERDAGMEDRASQEGNEVEEVQVKRESDESPGSHISESVEEWREGEDEKREEEEEGYDEKRAEENSEEESIAKESKGKHILSDGSDEKRDARRKKSKEERSDEDDEEEKTKRFSRFSHKNKGKEEGGEEEEEETKRGNRESVKRWTKGTKSLLLQKKAAAKEEQQEVPHHSKEVAEEEEDKKKRDAHKSPEEKELQMIARRAPEERKGLEEEGSASRKSEEPEIESLADIESELEKVAQKLHELRRG